MPINYFPNFVRSKSQKMPHLSYRYCRSKVISEPSLFRSLLDIPGEVYTCLFGIASSRVSAPGRLGDNVVEPANFMFAVIEEADYVIDADVRPPFGLEVMRVIARLRLDPSSIGKDESQPQGLMVSRVVQISTYDRYRSGIVH